MVHMKPAQRDLIACLIIDGLDGTGAVASLCECDPGAVSQWRKKGIPKARMLFLRAARPKFDWSQIPDGYCAAPAESVEQEKAA